ncbi:hypothetical protein [Stackebrandtia nassauensis]|uniref:DUF2637 domain-containing protein n=1 Tax=Stackebrandtia nassauensis (strain DSM 44728 / CIP 108903 / NRRL B-16338 / NBRC 102104 / LLR-40K-21) TaxID=446470 RepID=D3Q2G2_STANL|nr:hypothetical protein [Stackebrandtia nassauensis]ADD43895.1 hypothetical protein Snas_4246 [Stackebrandtia nassauensis DSM 44728]
MRHPNANTSARTVFLAIGKWTALVAAAFLTAKGEHELALLIGIHDPYAWLFPVALDVYAAVAFATHANREANIALALMVVCQSITHIQSAGPDNLWSVVLTVAVSAVPPIICQRVHHLGTNTSDETKPAPQPAAKTVDPEPVAVTVPALTAHPLPWPTARAETVLAEIAAATQTTTNPAATTGTTRRPAKRAPRKTREQRLADLRAIITARPTVDQTDAARHMGVSERYVRNLFPGSWDDFRATVAATG